MNKSVDLNCDSGESFGNYEIGNDEEVLKYVSSANIACGYHAGGHNVMARTIQLAKKYNVGIGAHPGFHDLIGFGRREIQSTARDIYNSIVYQIGALQAFCKINAVKLRHVKPHGALYNMAAKNSQIADAVAEAVKDVDSSLMLYGLANSELIRSGNKIGLHTVQEVFADRTYQEDGSLTPRSMENAKIHEVNVSLAQVLQIVTKSEVRTTTGKDIPIKGETICVHGDNKNAIEFVQKLKAFLENQGIEIRKVGRDK